MLRFWKERGIYEACIEKTKNGPPFIFFEGPPTANGRPGIHHVLSRVFKDIYVRFHTQLGEWVPRKAGWDCHGLPVEREVEKELGIQAKIEIEEKIGIQQFNELCRQSVLKYVAEWKTFSERLGFWVDYDRAYFTMDNDYIESVWSLLKTIWEKGLIYRDYKVVPFDPVMGATMSDAEVALGYKTVEDPSLTVRFRLAGDDFGPDASFLVWTTTPWTLPSNVALAVAPNEDYVVLEVAVGGGKPVEKNPKSAEKGAKPDAGVKKKSVAAKMEGRGKSAKTTVGKKNTGKKSPAKAKSEQGPAKNEARPAPSVKESEQTKAPASAQVERLICAKALASSLFGDGERKIVQTIKGRDLAGVKYTSLFDYMKLEKGVKAHFVVTGDFVTMDTGTGIVHIAPAYGADDLTVGRQNNLPVLHAVGQDGRFIPGTAMAGTFFKEADPLLIRDLKDRGLVFKSERYKHEYPFGWRTGAPLLYFAKEAWYIRTTEVRNGLVKNNQGINWVPDHIQEGRFGNWLENNRDWALSRERYWGTPLPAWMDEDGNFKMIGSRAELEELSGVKLADVDLHRPAIDKIEFKDKETGKTFRRVPEVIDCWFDSGAMPYAQWGLSDQGKQDLERAFPADFISEAIDQTRGWFYTLLAIGTMVSEQSPYKNVVCLGHVLDAKGEKMSKSKGNTVDPNSVFQSHGADAIRWYFLTGAPPGNSRRVGRPNEPGDPVVNVHGFFNMLRNSAGFFALYANVDGIEIEKDWEHAPIAGALPFAQRPDLDRWILSRLQVLITEVTAALQNYDAQKAGRVLEEFTDGLSNWYIRRNRRRFWKGELSPDKLAAYDTLHRCLVTVARLLAPFVPFLSEEIFRALVSDASAGTPESVHLSGWPESDRKVNFEESILREGDLLLNVAFLGRAARMQSAVKVRQPLSKLLVFVPDEKSRASIARFRDTLLDELNVKALEFLDESAGIVEYRVKPNLPRLGKRLGSRMREIQEFFRTGDAREIALAAKAGKPVWIGTGEDALELEAEDVLVESSSREGTAGAEGGGIFVALDTKLTPELLREGMVRDVVRNIQELRKKSGLNVTDRIDVVIGAGMELQAALGSFGGYLEEEVLGKIVDSGNGTPAGVLTIDVDKEKVEIQIFKR